MSLKMERAHFFPSVPQHRHLMWFGECERLEGFSNSAVKEELLFCNLSLKFERAKIFRIEGN